MLSIRCQHIYIYWGKSFFCTTNNNFGDRSCPLLQKKIHGSLQKNFKDDDDDDDGDGDDESLEKNVYRAGPDSWTSSNHILQYVWWN